MFFPVRPNQPKKSKSSKLSSSVVTTKQGLKRSSHGRSSRVSTSASTKDPPQPEPTAASSTSSISHTATAPRRASMPSVDTASRSGTASFLESRSSLPYPSFSKAHSKEDVRTANPPTPDPTDLTEHDDDKANGAGQARTENPKAPPSPPLTGLDDQPSSRRGSPAVGEDEKGSSDKDKEKEKERAKRKANIKIRAEVNRSSSSLRSRREDGTTKSSKTVRADTPKSKSSSTKPDKESSSSRTVHKSSSKSKSSDDKKPSKRSSRSTLSPQRSSITVRDVGAESANGSDATSIAPNQQQYTVPRKPMTPPTKPPSRNQVRSSNSHRHTPSDDSIDYVKPVTSSPGFGGPPPPPPPPEMPVTIPRVDYLLKDGGLENKVPRTLLGNPGPSDPFAHQATQPQLAAAKVFDPYNRLLDDYQKVMSKSGSLAVATGYRSVARRLLDRLEAVFARDISSEPCSCLMCDREQEEPQEGVSWGEVLELVSGRRELPMWPPFIMAHSNIESDIPGEEHIPMQKLDVDVPEEYRDHFIRQSRKTKVAVDKWLSEQNDQDSSAPVEVDDETLTFAMLTRLESHQRSLFCSLLGINSSTPVPRSGDEKPRSKPSALVSSSLAIQRLYRLSSLPRDPETAMFMLNNPALHHVLATLSAISDDEWEILISGRFDGFLRSGAEDSIPQPGSRWNGSRSNTPFSTGGISRGPTPNYMDGGRPASQPSGGGPSSPASFGGPIALDEEMEITALAEVERDIFLGMEALEDAFEALHLKAEIVRRALRERSAGLAVANQGRRGSTVEARMGTPFSNAWESGTDDGFLDDDRSLAPDDSASNISSNRRRRPKRRTERRTPAPVEEEEEEDDRSHLAGRRDSRNSRRR